MIIYFTGTGNSRFAAQALSMKIPDECADIFSCLKKGRAGDFYSQTPYVFVCPTYAWRIPRIFSDFIRKSRFGGCNKAYFVMTCGSENGNSGKYLAKLCRECGFEYMGVFEIIMPENYLALFPVPDEAEARTIIKRSLPEINNCAQYIIQGRAFPAKKNSASDIVKSSAVNPLFYSFIVSAKKFRADEKCVSCGKCVQVCPLNNITLKASGPQWGTDCTHCMACICSCPVQAVEYGRASKGRPRYFNSYSIADIIS